MKKSIVCLTMTLILLTSISSAAETQNDLIDKLRNCPVGVTYGPGFNAMGINMWQLMVDSLLFRDSFGNPIKCEISVVNKIPTQYDNEVVIKLFLKDTGTVAMYFSITSNYSYAILYQCRTHFEDSYLKVHPDFHQDFTSTNQNDNFSMTNMLVQLRNDLYSKSKPSQEDLKQAEDTLIKMLGL